MRGLEIDSGSPHPVVCMAVLTRARFLGRRTVRERDELADCCDEHGRSAVWLAAAAGELGALQEAAHAGALVDQPDEFGVAALWCACAAGKLPGVLSVGPPLVVLVSAGVVVGGAAGAGLGSS